MAAEEFVDSTIAALKIIGMVPKSGKLCVRKGQLSLDDADNGQPIRRWIKGDSRDITIMHARNTINSAVKISKATMVATDELARWTLERLAAEMGQCEVGLQNLKTTYSSDSAMVANLDVLSDRLRAHRAELIKHLDRTAESRPPPAQASHRPPSQAAAGGGVPVAADTPAKTR